MFRSGGLGYSRGSGYLKRTSEKTSFPLQFKVLALPFAMNPSIPSRGGLVIGIPVTAVLVSSLSAATLTWDNSSADSLWTTPANWDTGTRPGLDDDTNFPAGLGGTIALDIVPNGLGGFYSPTARSLQFNDNYTVNGSSFTGAPLGLEIGVNGGSLVTFNAQITPNGHLVKSGAGTLIVGTALGTTNGVTINGGVLRANVAGTLGAGGDVATVNSGATLEINNFHHSHLITLNDGSTLRGLGNASTDFGTDSLVISGSATAISIGTAEASDVLRTDYMAGGSTSTVITVIGDGTLRLNSANALLASWVIPSGKVQIVATLENLGQHTAGSVTLSGGTLAVELGGSGADYTGGPGNNILVTANSSFLNDRSSAGTGRTATFGTLSMGSQTINVAAGPNVATGDAGFYFGNLTLTGNPVFSITQGSTGPGHLSLASLNGGVMPRTITKTGPGNLSFSSSGTNALVAGSTITVSDGGNLLLNFPLIGPDPTTAVTMAQNPVGDADLSMTDGTLMLRGHGSAAIYALPNRLTLGGTVVVDPDRNVTGYGNDVYRFADVTLKPGTVVSISGDSSFALGSLGPMVMEGNATLQGVDNSSIADGQCFLYGGISGGPASALTIGNTVRPINLTVGAASTYGGGTVMNGGNVVLSTASGFGAGTTTLNGGVLTLNADAALNGTVTVNGGTLVVNGPNVLAANPVLLSGGTLDLRTNVTATSGIPSLTMSGTSAINTTRVSSSGSAVLTIPVIDVAGDTTLTVTASSNVLNLFSGFDLAGDLTVSANQAVRVTSVTEDGSPRKFIKTGTFQLDLEGASSHSGGTEVLAGTLFVENNGALGSGSLTVGATSGTAAATAATAAFAEGLIIPNDMVIRSGSSGAATLDSVTGVVTWNGDVELQKTVTLDNGGTAAADTSYLNGLISGPGDISKISGGEIVLANASNSFGSGTATSVSVSAGTLTVATDGALGNLANGVNLTGSSALKISGTFGTARTIAFTGTAADVNVTAGNTLTLSSPVAGTGTFTKGDAGTLAIAPSVDASARGSAITLANGGILRVQGLKNLGDASPLSFDNGGIVEFLRDPDTNFAHPVSILGNGVIHVDRAAGGSGSDGRHSVGAIVVNTLSGNSLTVTGANGYGLSAPGYTTAANSTLTNNATGALILGALTGNPATSSRTLTIGGSGDIEITGATSEGAGTGTYGIVKTGSGKITFGSSLADFGRVLTVNDGTFDLNGNAYSSTQVVTMGGVASALGARIETGGSGSLNLGAGLTFGSGSNPAGALITGNVGLGALSQTFTINNSSGADPDLTIDGPITGSPGAAFVKSGSGTLRFNGAGNTQPGLVSANNGILELAKTSGDAIGSGGLDINPTSSNTTVRLLAADQIHNSAPVNLIGASEVFLDLNNLTETVGPLSLTQTDVNDYTAVKTGATGTLVLNGNLTFNNNINSSSNEERNVLVTGSGSEFTPAFDGFLDLGGATRTIHVTTTTVGANEPRANATIETQILNGGILKTGPRTLYLTNPNNTFAGGLQIAGGTVKSGGGTSLGLGPVTFNNPPGVSAGLDFGALAGPIADNFTLTGAGDVTFTYSGLAPDTLTLSGNFSTTQNLIFDVVNGSTAIGDSATLDLTGLIDDAAGSIGLTKIGNGSLRLDPGNTYSGGTTVQKGILSIAADSALGDSAADLVLDGGCFHSTASFALGRDLVFGANGGSVRGSSGTALDVPSLEWGAGASAFFGPGQTILSGATTGVGGDLALGLPTAFATASSILSVGSGHILSLRGTATLPAGNLNFTNRAVLELGNGDFTRAVGTAAGEVQLATATGGGWAAHGADRAVNLGGASAPVVWGQQSPPFLYQAVSGDDYGDLVLGSSSGTHTVDFQNLIDLNNGTTSVFRDLIVNDGPAAVDARISGGIRQTADPNTTFTVVDLECAGTLEISGPVTGEIHLDKLGTGTAILSGTNSFFGDLAVYEGTLEIASDASWGNPGYVFIEAGATLDISSMTTPIGLPVNEFIGVYGTLVGDVETASSFEGNGLADGNVRVLPGSYVYPDFNGLLHVTGDFTLDASAVLDLYVDDLVPETGYNRMRVGGAVNLSGDLNLGTSAVLAEGDSFVFILNDGVDPINGTFTGLPEGAGIPIGNGLALQVTYLANGDGGAVGNDFGASVVVDTFSTDLALTVDAPLAVDFGSSFTITYTVENFGPTDSTGSSLAIPLPPNAVLIGSTPAGTVNAGTLTIPVPALTVSATTIITVEFTAPGSEAAILVEPLLTANGIDGFLFDNQAPSVTAVMAGGCLLLSSFDVDGLNDELSLGIDTIPGVNYVLQRSTGLDVWLDYWFFEGDGEVQEFFVPMDEPKEFFRFDLVPYNGGGGGGGLE